MEVENSKNVNTGDVKTNGGDVHIGDITKTVNYYLSENKITKDLSNKIKGIDEKLNKDGISKDLKEHLLQEKYGYKQDYEKLYKAIEQAYGDVLKFGFTDEELKELQQLFLEGKHDEIEEKVNPKAIEENINIREEANKKDANKLLILAKSTAIQFEDEDRFEKTVKYFELSMKADRNEENLFYYAFFLQEEEKHTQAIILYEEVTELVQKLIPENQEKFLLFLARTKQNLASSQYAVLSVEKAEKSLYRAFEILIKLRDDYEEYNAVDIGSIFIDIGFIHNKKREFVRSEECYENAIKEFKTLAKRQPELHLLLTARAFSKLGVLKFDEVEFLKSKGNLKSGTYKIAEAKNFFLKSLKKYELLQISTEHYPTILFENGEVSLKLGNLLLRIHHLEEAIFHYKNALTIFKFLNKRSPQFYLEQEAGVLYNLEIAQKQMNLKSQK